MLYNTSMNHSHYRCSLNNYHPIFCEAKMGHSLSKLCKYDMGKYFNIVLIPTMRWIHIYYYKLYLLLI